MAFSFGSTPAFGAPASSSSSLFGASSAPAFGTPASSSSLFGASSTPSLFGAASSPAPAFGAPAAASSSSLFGSTPAPSLFGGQAASAPASSGGLFGASASQPSLFGGAASQPAASSTPSLFGGAAGSAPSLFGAQPAAASSSSSLFSFASAPQQQSSALGFPAAQQPQQQQQQPITYSTTFEQLPPGHQQELLSIQREVSNSREDSEKLERDQRLHDSAALKRGMEGETSSLKQILQGMANAVKADDDALGDFREKVMQLLRSTESAVRTFQRSKLWRDAPQQYKGQMVPPQVQELLASPALLPSPYLEQAVQGFQETLESYRRVVGELEQVLPADPGALHGSMSEGQALQALPLTVSYMHDYFVHVAAQMEQLHSMVARSKEAFLAQRSAAGDATDPFSVARRQEQPYASASSKPTLLPYANGDSGGAAGAAPPALASPFQPQQPAALPLPGPAASPAPGFPFASPFGTTFGTPAAGAAGDQQQRSKGRRR